MSTRQYYGTFSRLAPAIELVIDSEPKEFSGMVRFNTAPNSPGNPQTIVSGSIAATPTGTTAKTFPCARGMQTDSYFSASGQDGPTETTFPVLMGGNIAPTIEPERLYSWANSETFRGGDTGRKAAPGDALLWDGKAFLVSSALAMEGEPEEVAWQGEEFLPVTSGFAIGFQDIALTLPELTEQNQRLVEKWEPSESGFFSDTGLFVFDGDDFVAIQRRVFDSPGNDAPDEDYYPPNATFAGNQYWIHPRAYTFRLATSIGETGTSLAAVHYHTNADLIAAGKVAVVEPEETGAYGGTSDALVVADALSTNDFSVATFIYPDGAGNFGSGSIEWRLTRAANSPVAVMTWASNTITSVKVRTTEGGSLTSASFTAPSEPFTGAFFEAHIQKVGDDFTFRWRSESGTLTAAATVEIAGVETLTSGYIGIGAITTTKFLTLFPTRFADYSGDGFTASFQVVDAWADVVFTKTYSLPDEQPIEQAFNITANRSMEQNNTPGRNRYKQTGTQLTFYSETVGDRLTFRQSAQEGIPDKPGRAPRMAGTINMATQDSALVAENRAHWHDVLTVLDPHGEFTAGEGEAFSIIRGPFPVFDPDDPPTLEFAVRAAAELDASDWDALPEGEYVFREVEGLVLLSDDWLALFDPDTRLCFRAVGSRYRQSAAARAKQFNDLALGVENIDDGWVQLPLSIGNFEGVSGETFTIVASATDVVCSTGTEWRDVDWEWGQRREALGTYKVLYDVDLPAWSDTGVVGIPAFWVDSVYPVNQYDSTALAEVLTCNSVPYETKNLVDKGNNILRLNPFGASGSGGLFGSTWPIYIVDPLLAPPAGFTFSGPVTTAGEMISRLAALEAVCVEGRARVRFHDLKIFNWTYSYQHTVAPGQNDLEVVIEINGVTALHFEREGETVITDINLLGDLDALAATSGNISFVPVGRRIDSRNIELATHPGTFRDVPGGRWRSYGSGQLSSASVANGVWRTVDVTSLINGILSWARSADGELRLWPSNATDIGASADSLAGYLKGILPPEDTAIADLTYLGATVASGTTTSLSLSNQYVTFASFEIEDFQGRFRLPGDRADHGIFPKIWPPLAAAPAPE